MYKEVEKMTNSKKMNPQKLKDTLLKYALYIILLLLLVVIVAIKPNFLSVGNLISILKQASTKGILAYGVAGIIILAGTDLSVGRVLGLCAAGRISGYSRRDCRDPFPWCGKRSL